MGEKIMRFSLKKLSIGLASVAIGTWVIGYKDVDIVLAEELGELKSNNYGNSDESSYINNNTVDPSNIIEEQTNELERNERLEEDNTEIDVNNAEKKVSSSDVDVLTIDAENKMPEIVDSVAEKDNMNDKEEKDINNDNQILVDDNEQNIFQTEGKEILKHEENIAKKDTEITSEEGYVGKIAKITQKDNLVEIDYETGEKGRLYFYSDNTIRYYVDKKGEFEEHPKPSDKNRPAEIIIKKFDEADKIIPIFEDSEKNYQFSTNKISVQLNKAKSTLRIVNKETNEVVIDEIKPLKMTADKTEQTLKYNKNAHYYGGGTQNGRFAHKDEIIKIVNENNWVDGGVASPNPFYWSTEGYGVLRHTFKPGVYDFGKTNGNQVKTSHEENRFDAFYFINQSYEGIIKDYYSLTGDPVVMPKFSLYQGHLNAYNRDYWVEVKEGTPGAIYFEEAKGWFKEFQPNQLGNQDGIKETLNAEPGDKNYPFSARAVIERYARNDMPLGWMLVNDGYGAGYGQEDTLEGNIENLRKFSIYAKENGVYTGLWTQSDLYPKDNIPALLQRDLPNEVEKGLVRVLKTDVAWVGPGYSFGLNGVADAAKVMKEKGNNARPFIISLDGWAGTQRYAGIWTGDQSGGEWEYIRFHIPTYIGTGLSGNPNISSDMDGIFRGGDSIINTRDYQWKTFTLVELNMDGWGSNPKTPFAFDGTTTDINRSYLKLKSKLVPYVYSISHEALNGKPVMRAMFIDHPDENVNYTKEVQYQFKFGDQFLIAPIYQNTKMDELGNDIRNNIYLPAGDQWIDYFTGEIYDGGQVLNNFSAPIWKLPVFVKNGAIIPVTDAHNNPNDIDTTMRQIDFYPHGETSFTLIEDDGETNAYKNGEKATTQIVSEEKNGTVTLTINPTDGDYKGFNKNKITQFNINVSEEPTNIKLYDNGEKKELARVNSLDEFNQGTNVYYYDKSPNLNLYSTEGNRFYGEKITKNPVLRVKTDIVDVTKSKLKLVLQDYLNNNHAFKQISKIEGKGPIASVKEEVSTPTSLTISWGAVKDANRYEVLVNDELLFTNILEPTFTKEGLNNLEVVNFKVRAVFDNSYSEWSDQISGETLDDPYKWAIEDIAVTSQTPAQRGQELKYLVDKDTSTVYHSSWGKKAIPEKLDFDLKKAYKLDKLQYHPRQDAGNGTIGQAEVSYSLDGINWVKLDKLINWEANNEVKEYIFKDEIQAQFIQINVTQARGDFVSGNEIFVFRKEDSLGSVVGDVTGDGKIDDADIVSLTNYAGLQEGDSDFKGYVEVADINKNGVIDAYDIYYVTQKIGDKKTELEKNPRGKLLWEKSKSVVKSGEEVTLTLKGQSLSNVHAINSRLEIDSSKYEIINRKIRTHHDVNSMRNFSNVRVRSNNTQTAYVIVANQKGDQSIEDDVTIASITLRSKVDQDVDLSFEDTFMVGNNLMVSTGKLEDGQNEIEIKNTEITVKGNNEVYQPGYGVNNLVDGSLNSLTELKWNIKSNQVNGKLPEDISLPQDIIFEFKSAKNLNKIDIYKRTPGNGTVTKYKIKTYSNNNVVFESDEISIPYEREIETFELDNVTPIDKLVLTIIEAKVNENTVNNQMMTLREIQLFELLELEEKPDEKDKSDGEVIPETDEKDQDSDKGMEDSQPEAPEVIKDYFKLVVDFDGEQVVYDRKDSDVWTSAEHAREVYDQYLPEVIERDGKEYKRLDVTFVESVAEAILTYVYRTDDYEPTPEPELEVYAGDYEFELVLDGEVSIETLTFASRDKALDFVAVLNRLYKAAGYQLINQDNGLPEEYKVSLSFEKIVDKQPDITPEPVPTPDHEVDKPSEEPGVEEELVPEPESPGTDVEDQQPDESEETPQPEQPAEPEVAPEDQSDTVEATFAFTNDEGAVHRGSLGKFSSLEQAERRIRQYANELGYTLQNFRLDQGVFLANIEADFSQPLPEPEQPEESPAPKAEAAFEFTLENGSVHRGSLGEFVNLEQAERRIRHFANEQGYTLLNFQIEDGKFVADVKETS